MIKTLSAAVAAALLLTTAVEAQEAKAPPPKLADLERDLRAQGVGTLPEIDAIGAKLIPLYAPGEGLTPIDTSKCAQALPLLAEFKNKTRSASVLLSKMAEQLIAIGRLSALGPLQDEARRQREWSAMAAVDEGRCLAKAGNKVDAALRFVEALDLDLDGDGGQKARDELAKLLDYQN